MKPRKNFAITLFRCQWAAVAAAVLSLVLGPATSALAATLQQTYYVPMGEDDLLQLFDDIDPAGGNFTPVSPVVTDVGISIATTGTVVYWDQWENGTYESDLGNPTDIYNATTNPDGTQIWGDGNCANGFAPVIKGVAQTCTVGDDDRLGPGDVITLEELVPVTGSSGSYVRSSSVLRFDGRDRIGVTFPVAVTRNAFPYNSNPSPDEPLSLLAGGTEVFPEAIWGTAFTVPVGEDITTNTNAFNDVRLFVLAGAGGATVQADLDGNGTVDVTRTLSQGESDYIDGFQTGGTLSSNNPVQVHLTASELGSTFQLRWYALVPRARWDSAYVGTVGTATSSPTGSSTGCTEIWAYNPAVGTVVASDDFSSGNYTGGSGWNGNWIDSETGGTNNSPTAGAIQVVSQRARFQGVSGTDPTLSRAVNLSGESAATLSFVIATSGNLEDEDQFRVQISSDGSSFTTLATFSNDQSGTRSYDISAYLSATTTVRFQIDNGTTGSDEFWYVDDVQIEVGKVIVDVDLPGTADDTFFEIPPGVAVRWPATQTNLVGKGYLLESRGDEPFLPISVIDCTSQPAQTLAGEIYDWGYPLIPREDLTSALVVGQAPGCTTTDPTDPGICAGFSDLSRSGVWVTPLADTTIYVDYDGGGISCPSGAGAETVIDADALVTYFLTDDPGGSQNTVRDEFPSQSYSLNAGTQNWAGNWTEQNDDGSPSTGDILITGGELRIGPTVANGVAIYREANLTGATTATLSFNFRETAGGNDIVTYQVSPNGGTTWVSLGSIDENAGTGSRSVNITPYIAANTRVRFIVTSPIESNEFFYFDNVQIAYSTTVGEGDYSMTGARIQTCDGTDIAAAYGQNPARSGSSDNEARDLGTVITPFGSNIELQKTVAEPCVIPGQTVATYTFVVSNNGSLPISNVAVVDPSCSSTPVRTIGMGETLDPGVSWTYTCSSVGAITVETVNVAQASGTTTAGSLTSAPDEARVATRDIEIVKTGPTAPLTPGDTANFTITVTNTGSADLVNVEITDFIAPDCNRVIGGLAAGASRTYQCELLNVRASFTNVAVVDGEGTGLCVNTDVTDTDDAPVDVQPTAVTIGAVDLEARTVDDYLAGLDIGSMDDAALLALLTAWDPDAAAALAGADRAALLAALRAYLDPDGDGQVAVLRWETLEERGTIGFFVERSADGGAWMRLSGAMLPGLIASPMGAEYQLADPAARSGHAYEYQLIEQEAFGTTRTYGPFSVEMP